MEIHTTQYVEANLVMLYMAQARFQDPPIQKYPAITAFTASMQIHQALKLYKGRCQQYQVAYGTGIINIYSYRCWLVLTTAFRFHYVILRSIICYSSEFHRSD